MSPQVAYLIGFVSALLLVLAVAVLRGSSEIEEPMRPIDPDRCQPDHYYTSGPVTPMSREEAEDDARALAHRCARGTRTCRVVHVPKTDLPNPGARTT